MENVRIQISNFRIEKLTADAVDHDFQRCAVVAATGAALRQL
jgi:hypothetical protein